MPRKQLSVGKIRAAELPIVWVLGNGDNPFVQYHHCRLILLVAGGPGSGKGSQCEILAYKRNFKHISGGDLLRHEASVFSICLDFQFRYHVNYTGR